jgi:DNA-binding transcriptional LysR family regulator
MWERLKDAPGAAALPTLDFAQYLCGNADLMDWNDLRYLLAVHRAGTLSGAARELKVNHSTVSRRLTALEEALKTQLLIRTGDGFRLTAAGETALETALAIEASSVALERQIQGEDSRPSGKVRVTTSEALASFFMSGMAVLQERWPDLKVDIVVDNARLDLSRGEADIAIRAFRETQPDLVSRKIGDIAWGLYASEDYLVRKGVGCPESLDGLDVIAYDERLSAKPYIQWLDDHSRQARIAMRGNGPRAVGMAIIAGLGISVIPCFMAVGEPKLRRLRAEPVGFAELWVAYLPALRGHARVRVVLDRIDELFSAQAKMLSGAP